MDKFEKLSFAVDGEQNAIKYLNYLSIPHQQLNFHLQRHSRCTFHSGLSPCFLLSLAACSIYFQFTSLYSVWNFVLDICLEAISYFLLFNFLRILNDISCRFLLCMIFFLNLSRGYFKCIVQHQYSIHFFLFIEKI